jgi:hypothetical protein
MQVVVMLNGSLTPDGLPKNCLTQLRKGLKEA